MDINKLEDEKPFMVIVFHQKGDKKVYFYDNDQVAVGFAQGCFKQETVRKVQVYNNQGAVPVLIRSFK